MKTPRITIHRPREYCGKLRKLWIFVDGVKTAFLKNGESVSLDLAPGKHEIFVSSDYLKSNRLELVLDSEETVCLECGSTLRGIRICFTLFITLAAYLFKSVKVLYIKQVTSE